MKALYYHGIPQDIEQSKAKEPQSFTVMGSGAFGSQVMPAILRYGSYDRYYLPELPIKNREQVLASAALSSNLCRISFVPEHELRVLQEPTSLVMMTPGHALRGLAGLRDRLGRSDVPISGVLHSLNFRGFAGGILLEMLASLEPFDAIFTESAAGREAFQKKIELTKRHYYERLRIPLEFNPKLLHLTPGVESELYQRSPSESVSALRGSLGLSRDAIVILYLGRFSPVSKADLLPLILAFSRLPFRELDLLLVLAGDDTQLHISSDLLRFAIEVGCAEHLRIVPNVLKEDKLKLYKVADIFVAPSDCIQETFGVTVLEAMAASLPVVASDWNGYRDLVVNGETGFLIPTFFPDYSGDFDKLLSSGEMTADDLLARTTIVSLPHLSQSLLTLVRDPEFRQRLGKGGRDRVNRLYDWKKVIQSYEAAWDNLLMEATAHCKKSTAPRVVDSDSYSYKGIFGHYATRYLDLRDEILLPGFERKSPSSTTLLEMLASPKGRFDARLFKDILEALRGNSTLEVGQLLDSMRIPQDTLNLRPLDDRMIVLVHLARLLKYGLVQVSSS